MINNGKNDRQNSSGTQGCERTGDQETANDVEPDAANPSRNMLIAVRPRSEVIAAKESRPSVTDISISAWPFHSTF